MRKYYGRRETKSLKTYKKERIKIAKELYYGPKCIERIKDTTTIAEVDYILKTERLRDHYG